MTTLQKADAVLKFLNDSYKERAVIKHTIEDGTNVYSANPHEFQKHWKDYIEIWVSTFRDRNSVDTKEIQALISFLVKEKYVTVEDISLTDKNAWKYTITFAGKIFIEGGGYVGQNEKNDRLNKLATRQDSFNFWLVLATIASAIGSIGILLIEMLKCK